THGETAQSGATYGDATYGAATRGENTHSETTHGIDSGPAEDVETTRSLSAPDPDRTQAIVVRELAAPLDLLPPEPAVDLADHPGRAAGQNTATLSHTGDIGGDETQVIRLDPDRTQVIRPGTVEPPGERTEIMRIPAKGKATVPARTAEDGTISVLRAEDEIPAQREPS
ncbi:hypothetical protein M1L60_20610, partial [Actinoplanes sp. TRM 88003]